MPGLGRKTFNSGDTLTAADVQGYLMDQAVMVFAGTAARGSAIPTPSAGMVAYSTATQLQVYNGSSWNSVTSIGQVVSTVLTSTYTDSSASGTLTTITGLSATITPRLSTSKILILASVTVGGTDASRFVFGLTGGNSATGYIGDASGTRKRVATGQVPADANGFMNVSLMFLDSPATTSSTTYSVQGAALAGETLYINRAGTDTDGTNRGRGASTITVMEVLA